jgi:hypothetical protein
MHRTLEAIESSPLAVVAVLAFGTLLRAWNLHATGFTADEVAEVIKIEKPLADIIADRDDDRFPPLYRTTAALAVRAAGSNLAVRWLSVAYGAVTLVVVWRAGAELIGEREAVWPMLLLAASPFHINFCRDGRAYSLYCLFTAVMFWAALSLLRRGSWGNWSLLIISTAGAVYTHYYAGPLAVVVWGVVLAVAAPRDGWRLALTAATLTALLLLPAPFLLLSAMADLPDERLVAWFDVEALGYAFVSQATGFTVGPSMVQLRSMPTSEGIRQFIPWIAVLGFAYATLAWHAFRRLDKLSLALLFATVALVPVLGVVGNLAGVGFVFRYVGWMAIPYALVLGSGASRWRESRLAAVAVVALLAVNSYAIYNRRCDARYAEEDYRAVAERIDELDPGRRPVLVASHYVRAAVSYYTGERRLVASFPIFAAQSRDRETRIAAFISSHASGDRFWIVSEWLPDDDDRLPVRDAAIKRFNAKLEAELNQAQIYSAVVP